MISSTNPIVSALMGASLTVPFLALNAIIGNRTEPFFSLIRPGTDTSALEHVLLAVVLLCLPAGAFVVVRPMRGAQRARHRSSYLVNGLLAALILAVFLWLSIGLGSDINRCDVLQIPNCD
jgi:hypothetical protein